jgi:hypothetical protein
MAPAARSDQLCYEIGMVYVFRIGPYGPDSPHAGKSSYVALLHEAHRVGVHQLALEADDVAGLQALLPLRDERPVCAAALAGAAAQLGLGTALDDEDLAETLEWWSHALTLAVPLAAGVPVKHLELLMALVSAGGAFEAVQDDWEPRNLQPFTFAIKGEVEREGVGHVVVARTGLVLFLFPTWAEHERAGLLIGADLAEDTLKMESITVSYDTATPAYLSEALAYADAQHLPRPLRTTRQGLSPIDQDDLWVVAGVLRAAAELGPARQVTTRVELSGLQVVEVRLELRDPSGLSALRPGTARA